MSLSLSRQGPGVDSKAEKRCSSESWFLQMYPMCSAEIIRDGCFLACVKHWVGAEGEGEAILNFPPYF